MRFWFSEPSSNGFASDLWFVVDRGPWYNWSLDDLDLNFEARRETWGDRSLVESIRSDTQYELLTLTPLPLIFMSGTGGAIMVIINQVLFTPVVFSGPKGKVASTPTST